MHHKILLTKIIYSFLIPILFIYSCSLYALPEDVKQKIHIIADAAIYNYKTGQNIFTGHIKIDQGTTHLTADKLITKGNSKFNIQVATAYGTEQLAHYWTIPKKDEPEMNAYAKIIRFYPNESNVTLEHSVTVTQGDNRFKGELVHYNKKDETIIVPRVKGGRAILIYNPDT